jgi:hypothetical protein
MKKNCLKQIVKIRSKQFFYAKRRWLKPPAVSDESLAAYKSIL